MDSPSVKTPLTLNVEKKYNFESISIEINTNLMKAFSRANCVQIKGLKKLKPLKALYLLVEKMGVVLFLYFPYFQPIKVGQYL